MPYFGPAYFGPQFWGTSYWGPGSVVLATPGLTDLDFFLAAVAALEATGHFDAVVFVQGDQEPEFSTDHRRVAIVRDPGEYEEPYSDTGTQEHVHAFEVAIRVRATDDEAGARRLKWLERVAKSEIVGQSFGIAMGPWTTLESDRIEFTNPDRTAFLVGEFRYSFDPNTWDTTEPD